jgi:hypothetical protein
MKTVAILLTALTLCACRTEYVSSTGEPTPRYANEVQVARYDATDRQPTAQLEVFSNPQALGNRPYRVIALLTREGYRRDEGLIMNAIAWRARQIGAEGLIPEGPVYGGSPWAHGRWEQPVFRALAIVFSSQPPPPPPPAPDSGPR